MSRVNFFVPGIPATGGSKRAFVNHKNGKMVVMDDCKRNKDWRAVVALFGSQAMDGRPPLAGPIRARFSFILPRPKAHYGTGKNAGTIKASRQWALPTTKPDVLKLARAAEDALTGICWQDDAQTVCLSLTKQFGEEPGVHIKVQEATQ